MLVEKQATRIKKAHIALMKHPATALYSGVMLMGKNDVVEGNFTAYTDGVNKRYCADYIAELNNDALVRAVVLHENLHVALKHIFRGKEMYKENRKIANLAVDFVVNDIIANIKDNAVGSNEPLLQLSENWVYDPMFHNWSVKEVWDYIKQHGKKNSNPEGDGDGDSGGESIEINGKEYDITQDEHDWEKMLKGLSQDELKELSQKIDEGLRQGGILAGRMGGKMPRAITDMLEPKVDWREVLREFVSSSMKGKDEYSWRRLNRRGLANDIYMPSMENESMGDIVVAIDTSGSIGDKELSEFASELVSICELCNPEKVRILWWDTEVAGEQEFSKDSYSNIAGILKPAGGGGTYVSSVAKYIQDKRINAECVIVFTDGYTEDDIKWDITAPTLWTIVHGNSNFNAPVGKIVHVKND